MADANNSLELIYQNLKDAGCDNALIDKRMAFVKNGESIKIIPKLQNHRKLLLNRVRCEQKQIDCLDFLVFEIRKNFY